MKKNQIWIEFKEEYERLYLPDRSVEIFMYFFDFLAIFCKLIVMPYLKISYYSRFL